MKKFRPKYEQLSELCDLLTDGTHFSPPLTKSGRPYVTSRNVRRGWVITDDVWYISEASHSEIFKRCPTQRGDVWLTKDGANCGNAALNPFNEPVSLLSSVAVIRPTRSRLDAQFLLEWILSQEGQNRIAGAAQGLAITRVTLNMLRELRIPVPSIHVQRQIARIGFLTSKIDRTIGALIAAKREQKRGLMQQLFTGKLRFPGFTEPWKTVRIDQLGVVKSGGTPSTDTPEYWGGVHSWCTPTDVTALNTRYLKKTTRTISDSGVKFSAAELLPPQSVIVCTRATVGIAAINTIPMATNQGFKSIIPGLDVDTDFLYYAIMFVKRELLRRAAGSTFLEVSLTSFREIPILWPSSLNEQKRVSRFLGALDHEIELLAQQRAAFAAQRRGLMEKLLSGEIDIQNPKETAA